MKCFYHNADLDGHCSGAIVKYFNPECELIPINYGHDFPWESIYKDEWIYMVDFGLQPFDGMIRLNQLCHLVWIDHHGTAIEDCRKSGMDFKGVQAVGLGACALTWEYFALRVMSADDPIQLPYAVKLLAEYDVWNHSDPNTLKFQYGLRLQDTDPRSTKAMSVWKVLFRPDNEFVNQVIHQGGTVLEYEAQNNSKFCKAYSFETFMPAYPVQLAGPSPADLPPLMKAVCVNKGFTNSKVFDSIWNPEKYELMITFCRLPLPKKQWTVSLYSDKPDVDCGAIAKSFGGGGHKGAAGFQCNELPFEN